MLQVKCSHPLVKLLAIPALYSTVVLSGLARLRFRKVGRSLSLFMPIANSFSASASITTRYPMKREQISTRKLETSWQEVKLAAPEVFFK
ncbi:hypothetical protein PI126_g17089 [Phytophthora idaei]|nr:hypothetical protein PI126_g17089 [Phytophthora idaei]